MHTNRIYGSVNGCAFEAANVLGGLLQKVYWKRVLLDQ